MFIYDDFSLSLAVNNLFLSFAQYEIRRKERKNMEEIQKVHKAIGKGRRAGEKQHLLAIPINHIFLRETRGTSIKKGIKIAPHLHSFFSLRFSVVEKIWSI